MRIQKHRPRLYLIFIFFNLCLSFLILRLFYIQLIQTDFFTNLAIKQHDRVVTLPPKRGIIYDRHLKELAVTINLNSIYAVARDIPAKDKPVVAKSLSAILGLNYDYLQERLSRDKSFIWLARQVSPSLAWQVKNLNIKGVDFVSEHKRFYPGGSLASHIIGVTDIDNNGLEGIELLGNKYLRGKPGYRYLKHDGKRRWLPCLEYKYIPAADGHDIVLTIDEIIQSIAERELDKVYKDLRAKGATIIIMEPRTGEILALANRPTYDLNNISQASMEERRNRAVTDFFEPGSTFKIVTASAALEEKAVSLEDRFFCENGTWPVAGHILHDHTPHGWLTFKEVIVKSSNIGTVKVAQKLGADKIYKYMKLFGFGATTGVNLPGEVTGIVKHPRQWSKTTISAVPMGQEVTVTALQLLSAIACIANDGVMVKPMVIKYIREQKSSRVKLFSPVQIRQVISPETSRLMKQILSEVVKEGTGKLAQIPGYTVAGKTGTSQKIEDKAYSHRKFIASFVGFAPVDDPKIAVVVMVDEPRPYYFGGTVAAPVFQKVASETLRYLSITSETNMLPQVKKNNPRKFIAQKHLH